MVLTLQIQRESDRYILLKNSMSTRKSLRNTAKLPRRWSQSVWSSHGGLQRGGPQDSALPIPFPSLQGHQFAGTSANSWALSILSAQDNLQTQAVFPTQNPWFQQGPALNTARATLADARPTHPGGKLLVQGPFGSEAKAKASETRGLFRSKDSCRWRV